MACRNLSFCVICFHLSFDQYFVRVKSLICADWDEPRQESNYGSSETFAGITNRGWWLQMLQQVMDIAISVGRCSRRDNRLYFLLIAQRVWYSPLTYEDGHYIQKVSPLQHESSKHFLPSPHTFTFYIKVMLTWHWNRHFYVLQKYYCKMAKMPKVEIDYLLRLTLPKEQIFPTHSFWNLWVPENCHQFPLLCDLCPYPYLACLL